MAYFYLKLFLWRASHLLVDTEIILVGSIIFSDMKLDPLLLQSN